MTEVRLQPQFTRCPEGRGESHFPHMPNRSRHTAMIQDLGKCRICGQTKVYEGPREEMLDKISDAFLKLYISRDEAPNGEAVWSMEDILFTAVMNLAEDELPAHVEADADLEVDYDTEGLRIIHQALLRAAGKIEGHLNAAGEEV